MSDVDLILQLQQELKQDESFVMDVEIDPLDPVEVEMIKHEADFAIDQALDRYRPKYQPRFEDPQVFDNFVLEHKLKIRKVLDDAVAMAKAKIRAMGYDAEDRDPFAEKNDEAN